MALLFLFIFEEFEWSHSSKYCYLPLVLGDLKSFDMRIIP